jgi:hypothetical protein
LDEIVAARAEQRSADDNGERDKCFSHNDLIFFFSGKDTFFFCADVT